MLKCFSILVEFFDKNLNFFFLEIGSNVSILENLN